MELRQTTMLPDAADESLANTASILRSETKDSTSDRPSAHKSSKVQPLDMPAKADNFRMTMVAGKDGHDTLQSKRDSGVGSQLHSGAGVPLLVAEGDSFQSSSLASSSVVSRLGMGSAVSVVFYARSSLSLSSVVRPDGPSLPRRRRSRAAACDGAASRSFSRARALFRPSHPSTPPNARADRGLSMRRVSLVRHR